MDRLYAIKKPLEYNDVVKKDQLLRSLDITHCSTEYNNFAFRFFPMESLVPEFSDTLNILGQ